MNEKTKRFPLQLSSIAPQAGKMPATRHADLRHTASLQTATRNATRYAEPKATSELHGERHGTGGEKPDPMVSSGIRKAMVSRLSGKGVRDPKVLAAMEIVPRHLFVEPGLSGQAYADASLPIGHHQTISQPYIVARMIELLRNGGTPNPLTKVLEIGTGCGYQAAVLSVIAGEVYSVERIKSLHELAKSNLRPLRIPNIRLHYGDGMLGLTQAAPFNGIILAAAGIEVPKTLLDQLVIGGRLIAPVGEQRQTLQLIERISQCEWSTTFLEDCHFVPLRPGISG